MTTTTVRPLTPYQVRRYSRHIIMPQVGSVGQRKLIDAKTLIVGAGGLGSPIAIYLTLAGVGTIGLVDFDTVDVTNLQRQVLHYDSDIGKPKVQSAVETLNAYNPETNVITHEAPLTSDNAMEIIQDYDIVINGADNFPARYLVNDAAYLSNKPLVDGSILLFDGMATVFLPGSGCYRCLFPTPPPPGEVPSCAEAGVLGMLPGMVGTIQATETVKLILGIGESLSGRLLLIDALEMDFRTVKLRRNPECPLCGDNPTVTELIDYVQFCGGRRSQDRPPNLETNTRRGGTPTMAEQPAHPESIVTTDWISEHLGDANVRLVEVDVDTAAYDQGHVPGAVGWNWSTQLNDQLTRDILTREQMESLLSESGIGADTTVVLYGDNNNWFATYAFWQMRMYGHGDLKIMDGGRQKWIDEGREVSTEAPSVEATSYSASNPDTSIRATRDYVLSVASTDNSTGLVDVRAPDEYNGTLLAPANLPQEGSQRGGHIPGAANIPWASAVAADGTFKSVEELREIYGSKGISDEGETIAYCRIGERSSHTWFVLSQILGHSKVRNYDGSWTEYGSIVGAPIER